MKYYLIIVLPLLFFVLNSEKPRISHSSSVSNSAYGLSCSNFNAFGVQRCIAGINSSILNVVASDRQRANQWCWAASIEAVLNYYGYNITQEDIVFQTWGQIRNMPGTPRDILSALNKIYIDRDGRRFRVSADVLSANHITAAQDLSNNNPLIIGTLGHAMVLTAVEFDRNRNGNGQIVNAIVRDPWPESPGRRSLTPKEWNNTSLLVRIRVN
jgi:hypothetical protein